MGISWKKKYSNFSWGNRKNVFPFFLLQEVAEKSLTVQLVEMIRQKTLGKVHLYKQMEIGGKTLGVIYRMDQRKWAKIMIPYLPKLCSDGQLAHLMRDPPYILSAAAPPAPSAHSCIFTLFCPVNPQTLTEIVANRSTSCLV